MYRNRQHGVLAMTVNRLASLGFTLIELMVTLAIVAVLMAVATPSFISFQRNAELSAFANTLLSAVNTARSEAMKRGRHTMVIPADATDWQTGWIVFVDVDRSNDYDATKDILVMTAGAAPAFLTVGGTDGTASIASPYLMYDASGYSKKIDAAFSASVVEIKRNDVSDGQALSQTRRLRLDRTGRARVCTPTTTTDAQCAATISG